jgi:hypothetical protein
MWISLFRNIPLDGMNMTNVLISYYIEVVNLINIIMTVPLIYVTLFQPLPFLLAQFVIVATHCCGSMIVSLGSAISCFQILYVIRFELVFSLDPQIMGRRIFLALLITVVVPYALFGIWKTLKGSHVDKGVTLYTLDEYNGEEIEFLAIYSICWALLYFIFSFIAFVFLPIVLKKRQSHNERLPPQRTISLQRYLLASLGLFVMLISSVIMNKLNNSNRLSVSNIFAIFALTLLLAYHLTEKETRNAANKFIFKLINIEETRIVKDNTNRRHRESKSQQLQLSSSSGIATVDISTNAVPKSTFIMVSAASNELEEAY